MFLKEHNWFKLKDVSWNFLNLIRIQYLLYVRQPINVFLFKKKSTKAEFCAIKLIYNMALLSLTILLFTRNVSFHYYIVS